jgi:hypothetical protein
MSVNLDRLAEAVERIAFALESQKATGTSTLPPEALSKKDAAQFIGVSVKTIEYLIRTRQIKYVQLGSQRGRVIPVKSLRKFLRDHLQPTGEELLKKPGRA